MKKRGHDEENRVWKLISKGIYAWAQSTFPCIGREMDDYEKNHRGEYLFATVICPLLEIAVRITVSILATLWAIKKFGGI